ncbi:Ribosomal RNA small subunit methyltransferase F [Caloramator mitchellensis]|uniref:Ribosomal RNA small subunit methyltransferase F n=1 Tax=Caloramator mitchellensis TaxID=908809 RepID=A0A0R3JX26_CALMK|nr:RsmB/NOP family class I SAM-dependent RNA methyltransferase [Caloramator mitchellensis]KRQ88102.1 Ribosomal RNA small subunit methyltransferase F [Caloramator mitchellensis]
MTSIKDARRRLPQELIDSLYDTFTEPIVDKILYGYCDEKYTTLRVNTLKYDIHSLMNYFKQINIKFERVSWYNDALILKNAKEKDIQKLDIYKNGYIYLQNLSSMIPPIVLEPKEGEKVLDVAAAPGSKTTQIASMMKNTGYILANEVDHIRAERLRHNIQLQGANIIEVRESRGEILGDEIKDYFDKVLLDVPCSGEGIITIDNPKSIRGWSLKEVEKLSKLQKKLFESAYKALKPNGIMVYSTCTLNKKENELVIDWAINNFKIKILDLNLKSNSFINAFSDGLHKDIKKAIRVLPSKEYEGFFVCKIQKLAP